MRIEGAGGCFDDRIYDLDKNLAWNIVLATVNELDVTVDEIDQANYLVKFHNNDKFMVVAVQAINEDTVHILMDSTKERLQIYSWKKETGEVEAFYDVFEKKVRELSSYVICPHCGERIGASAKFCPECGAKIK